MEADVLVNSETNGVTASGDVLDNLLGACKGLFLEERRQASINLRRAERTEQERDEARAELRAAKLQLEAVRPLRDPYAGVQNSMVVCLIDADGAIPASNRLKDGFIGGQQAAKDLRVFLLNYIEEQGFPSTNVSVIVSAYCNQKGLRDTLVLGNHCENAQFSQFWNGFQSAGLFCLIDVGPKKEAADAKIHAAMLLYARMPQVSRLFLGVAHDGGYHHPLSTLIHEGYVGKVVLLRYFAGELPIDIRDLRLADCRLDGLFMVDKLQTPRGSGKRSLPSTPKMNPYQGGHRRSSSLATESSGSTAAQDEEISPPGQELESLGIGTAFGLPVVEDGDSDVRPASSVQVELHSTAVEAFVPNQSLPLVSCVGPVQVNEEDGNAGVDGPRLLSSPPTITLSPSPPRALADEDRVLHGDSPGLIGPPLDPLLGSNSDTCSVTSDDMTMQASSAPGHRSGKPRPHRTSQAEALCFFEYIIEAGRCVRGNQCRYSHSAELTEWGLQELRLKASTMPCMYVRNNQDCPYGTKCPMAHECPHEVGTCQIRKCKFPPHMRSGYKA